MENNTGPGKGNPASIPYGPRTGLPMFTHSKGKWTLPIRPRLNPVQACPWFTRTDLAQAVPWMPFQIPAGPPCGICTGNQGASRACPYGVRSNPGAHPVKSSDRPRTGFDRALWACPVKSRTGPSRVRYLGSAVTQQAVYAIATAASVEPVVATALIARALQPAFLVTPGRFYLPGNTNAPIWSMSIERHGKFLLGYTCQVARGRILVFTRKSILKTEVAQL